MFSFRMMFSKSIYIYLYCMYIDKKKSGDCGHFFIDSIYEVILPPGVFSRAAIYFCAKTSFDSQSQSHLLYIIIIIYYIFVC